MEAGQKRELMEHVTGTSGDARGEAIRKGKKGGGRRNEGKRSRNQSTEVVTTGAPAPGNTPTLDAMGVDLTGMEYDGELDAVYGRNVWRC